MLTQPLLNVLNNLDGIKRQLVELVNDYAPEHVGTLEAALDMPLLEKIEIVAEGLRAAYSKPRQVRGCKDSTDFVEPASHAAMRFFLYRRCANALRYEGARLPLPWEVEVAIKGLYPGAGMEEWVMFDAAARTRTEEALERAFGPLTVGGAEDPAPAKRARKERESKD